MKRTNSEEGEIQLVNDLKALFQSIRSCTFRNQSCSAVLKRAQQRQVRTRIELFERTVKNCRRLDKKCVDVLTSGLKKFENELSGLSNEDVVPMFTHVVVTPLERELKTMYRRKNRDVVWLKTAFVILKSEYYHDEEYQAPRISTYW